MSPPPGFWQPAKTGIDSRIGFIPNGRRFFFQRWHTHYLSRNDHSKTSSRHLPSSSLRFNKYSGLSIHVWCVMSQRATSLWKRLVENPFYGQVNWLELRQAAQRLASKRSKIAAPVLREVKNFFEQDTYVNHPDQIEGYVRWALQPDGPAYHETPTPITCKLERSHQEYIVRVIPVLMFIKICSVSIISTRKTHFNHPSLSGLQSTSFFKQIARFSIRRSVRQIHRRDSMGFCSFLYGFPFVSRTAVDSL